MAVTEKLHRTGRTAAINSDVATAVPTFHPNATSSSPTFTADEDKQFGAVQCWVGKIVNATADVAYDAAGAVFDILGTKPTLSNGYRIIKIETVLNTLRTGGTPDHDLKIQKGDGAASEAFSDVVATVDFDTDTVGLPTNRTLVPAQCFLATGQTLRCQASVAGTTTGGTLDVEFHIWVIPANA